MSYPALNAVWSVLPTLKDRLKTIEAKRRPGADRCALVLTYMADRHRLDTGLVTESVDQIAAATGLSTNAVRSCLSALDELGIAPVMKRGGPGKPSRRGLDFASQLSGADPTELNDEQRGADPTESPVDIDTTNDTTAWGNGPNCVGLTPRHPGTTPVNTPLSPPFADGSQPCQTPTPTPSPTATTSPGSTSPAAEPESANATSQRSTNASDASKPPASSSQRVNANCSGSSPASLTSSPQAPPASPARSNHPSATPDAIDRAPAAATTASNVSGVKDPDGLAGGPNDPLLDQWLPTPSSTPADSLPPEQPSDHQTPPAPPTGRRKRHLTLLNAETA